MTECILENIGERKFLVTGASGWIGKNIVKRLAEYGAKAVAVDIRVAPELKAYEGNGVEIMQADLTEPFDFPEGVTDVLHAAGKVADWGSYASFYKINVGSTERLLEQAAAHGVKRFLYFSSIDLHGFLGHVDDTEDGLYHKVKGFYYPMTKIIGEKKVSEANSVRMKTVSIRPSTVYGPGDTTVHQTIMENMERRTFGFVNRGRLLISRVYIDDLLNGMFRALELGHGGEAYNITSGEKITWREWSDAICEELGIKPIKSSFPYWFVMSLAMTMQGAYKLLHIKTAPLLTRMRIQHAGHDFHFWPEKAMREIGFHPETPWQEGVKRMARYYKDNK